MNTHPALQALLDEGSPSPERLDAFVEEHRPFPLRHGSRATFLYRGEAKSVRWQHWIFGLPTSQEFTRVEGTDLWHLTVELRKNSRIEYKLLIDHGERATLVRDPYNPLLAHDPYGANSGCATEGYERPEWTLPDPSSRKGTLETRRLTSPVWGDHIREFQVYLPARYRENLRYPLLVVHDGRDYLRFSSMQTVLDNLIHRLEVAPLIVAFSNPEHRLGEYAADAKHARHIAEELVPSVEALYPVETRPALRCLMGASFGGVASLYTAWKHPEAFGNLLLQSGSFAFTDIGSHERGPAFDPVVDFMNDFRSNPGVPAEKIFVSCGIYESLIYENRSLIPLLDSCGIKTRFVEVRDGHNWENWRDQLRKALCWIFPGPLWKVYE